MAKLAAVVSIFSWRMYTPGGSVLFPVIRGGEHFHESRAAFMLRSGIKWLQTRLNKCGHARVPGLAEWVTMKFRRFFQKPLTQIAANPNEMMGVERRELLIVTRDQRFLSATSYLVTSDGWTFHWATSLAMAEERLWSRPIPFVVYDWQASEDDWTSAIAHFRPVPEEPYVILAAEGVDERLWCRAVGMKFYDVVERDLQKDHLLATLTFAWKRKTGDKLILAGVAAHIAQHAGYPREHAK
jgi:hypothetical protein